jgi:hypothetical protein
MLSKKGSNCVNAVITKIIYCHKSRTHYHPRCIGGNNFCDCYDQIAHPPASIALQSWGVSREAIGILLLAMQTMRFFLCMGYGKLALSYGGSVEERTLGFGQGNAVVGPGFLTLSAHIVNAYIWDGHGSHTLTSFSKSPSTLTAVIYLDNIDLIHTTPSVCSTPMERGGLAIATGAALEPKKCFAYFMVYKFHCGRAYMGTIATLPPPTSCIPQIDALSLPLHLTVPLPNGLTMPIPTLPPSSASLMLGIWFGPSSRGTKHINEMCQNGHNWADCLHSRPLLHSEAWVSFSRSCTLACHGDCPLSSCCLVNCTWQQNWFIANSSHYLASNATLNFCGTHSLNLSKGIRLPKFALHSLASKLKLLQCIWGFKDAASHLLLMGYELFLMDVRMYGNLFKCNYNHFSSLAIDGLLHDFNVTATFGKEIRLRPVRLGNLSFMHEFSKHFHGAELASLNVYCTKRLSICHELFFCDGCTINKKILTLAEG